MSRFKAIRSLRLTSVQYISLIVFLGFFSYTQYNADMGEQIRADPIASKAIRIVTVAVSGLIAVSVAARGMRRNSVYSLRTMTVCSLVLFLFSCTLSVPFSVHLPLSLFKSFEILLAVLLCVIGITSPDTRADHFFRWNVKLIFLLNIIVWTEAFVFPDLAWRYTSSETPFLNRMLSGVYPCINPNTVGLIGAVLFLAGFPKFFKPEKKVRPLVAQCGMGLASVVFSYSRVSLIGLVVAVMCTLIMLKRYVLACGIILFMILVALGSTSRTRSMDYLARGKAARDLDSLSSFRIRMWEDILQKRQSLIVGSGYAAGFRYAGFDSDHAHNSIFELYYNNGLVGVLAWLLMISSVCLGLGNLWKLQGPIDGQLTAMISILIFLMIKACAASVFVYLDLQLFMLVSMIIYIEKNRQGRGQFGVGPLLSRPANSIL